MLILLDHLTLVFTCACITDASWFLLQRDPAEEALKSNNMNLDQAMSALLEKKTELDKRGMAISGHDYNGLINKPMSCPRPPLLSKDPSADPRLPFMDKVNHFIHLNNYCGGHHSKCFLSFYKYIVYSLFCYYLPFCPADAERNVWWSSTSQGGAAAAASSTACAASQFLSA